jgi:hypothetical protein
MLDVTEDTGRDAPVGDVMRNVDIMADSLMICFERSFKDNGLDFKRDIFERECGQRLKDILLDALFVASDATMQQAVAFRCTVLSTDD